MKILNLYSGIGGNRKLWDKSHQITAVEFDPKIAEIYQDFFPQDKVIVADAHEYLLHNFANYDFIWSSPPCPSHSDIRRCGVHKGQNKPIYAEMSLYQEIILLQNFYKGGYCVENVVPYYKPLILAQKRDRHLFWANFAISEMPLEPPKMQGTNEQRAQITGFDLSKYKGVDKRKLQRNCVMPMVGKRVLECYLNQQPTLI